MTGHLSQLTTRERIRFDNYYGSCSSVANTCFDRGVGRSRYHADRGVGRSGYCPDRGVALSCCVFATFWWEARAQEQGQPLQPPAGLLSRYPA